MCHQLKNYLIHLSLMGIVLFGLSVNARETARSEVIADDLEYRQYRVTCSSGTVTVHMLQLDLDAVREGRLELTVEPGGQRVGQTASPQGIAGRTGALGSMNGPYFASAGGRTYPLGFTAMNGHIAQLGNLMRPLVGIDPDGELRVEIGSPEAFVTSDAYFQPIWLYGINSPAANNAVTLYDLNWGGTVSAQDGIAVVVGPLVVDPDEVITVVGPYRSDRWDWDGTVTEISGGTVDIPSDGYVLVFRGEKESDAGRYSAGNRTVVYAYQLPDGWETMEWIATLGPWFVHDGHLRDYSEETSYSGNILGHAQRSIIGLTWNDEVFLAITRGPALSVEAAAEVMIECNAREAVMCDSGSSSGMWADGIGALGSTRNIPLAFVIREPGEGWQSGREMKVWEGDLFRY